MEKASTKVLVIGGGVGGLALALFLDKAGILSEIYEAYPYKEGVGGAVNMAPNGMNVLGALGLADKAIKLGCITSKLNFKNQEGKTFASLNYDTRNKYGQPSLSIARSDLYEVLKNEIEVKGIKINYEKRLKSIEESSTKVTAYFEDGTNVEGSLLIGSDGIHSQTRNYIVPNMRPTYSGLITFGSFAPIAEIKSLKIEDINSLNFAYGTHGFFGYGGRNANTMMWWTTLPQKQELTKEELDQLTPETIKERMRANFKDYFDLIKELIEKSTECVKISISDIDPLPTWHKGRIVLIGDAAHAVSPNSGQGLSMALEDAMHLAKMLKDNSDYQTAFAKFEEHRKPRAEKIVAEGRRRAIDKEILSPFQEKMKEFMMGLFVRFFGDSGDDWIYKYKIDWDN